jgi:Holliday junction resolvase RusA-like endonuclease
MKKKIKKPTKKTSKDNLFNNHKFVKSLVKNYGENIGEGTLKDKNYGLMAELLMFIDGKKAKKPTKKELKTEDDSYECENEVKLFTITIPKLPETDNHTYLQRGKMRFMTKEAKAWKELCQTMCKEIWKEEPMEGDLSAAIHFYVKRDRDVHGSGKNLMDSMQGIIYNNDSQFTQVEFYKERDKENPRVEINIYQL